MIYLNLIEDILNIVKDDERHNIKVVIESLGITIYLDDDPDGDYEEKYIVPVRYDSLFEGCYIPHDEYLKCMSDDVDCGIDKEEIDLIQKIMEYLENNKEEINHYCDQLNPERRDAKSGTYTISDIVVQNLSYDSRN